MFKTVQKLFIGLLVTAPLMTVAAHAPSYINDAFPVYSAPSKIEYQLADNGLHINFEVTKNYQCVIPSTEEQDVFATLTYRTADGALAARAANILKDQDEATVFKNILVLRVPTVLGPYLVEIPDEIYSKLESVQINILCDRPILGRVYTKIGPFPFDSATTVVTKAD